MPTLHQTLDIAIQHHQAGRLKQAKQLYEGILHIDPQNVDALHLLGVVLHQLGDRVAAIDNIHQALVLKPDSATFLANLAAVYLATGEYQEAVRRCREALRLEPTNVSAQKNLGLALRAQGKTAEAHLSLGNAMVSEERLAEAVSHYQQALKDRPGFAEAHHNLGAVFAKQQKPQQAMASFERALQLKPDYAEAYNNLGWLQLKDGRLDDAIVSFERAIEVDSDYAVAHMCLGIALLTVGDFARGWSEYEWRWRSAEKPFKPREFSKPLWDGSPLVDRTILLHAEQGLGDAFQFIRLAKNLHRQGARVVTWCHPPLFPLLSLAPGIGRVVIRREEIPPFDVHVPLMSLPGILGITIDSIPADVPYLFARDDLIWTWKDRLNHLDGFKVGIAWQGATKHRGDRERSFSLSQFSPLSEIPNVSLISLQKGVGGEQLASVQFCVESLGAGFDEQAGAFMDTAAVMMNLDLVITSDTAVAHLAGGLGVPVWVLLSFAPDFRWLLDREDSPWYPTMRLFRQNKPGDWEGVFQRVKGALTATSRTM